MAVSGDTAVVGAYFEDSSTTGVNSIPNDNYVNPGAAYVFVRTGTNWTQQAYLKPSNTDGGDLFGYSVAVSGDTAIIGAYREDSGNAGVNSTPNEAAVNAGAAYVFVRGGTNWSQQSYLKPSNPDASDQFGISVALDSNTVVVGAFGEDSSTTGVNSTQNNDSYNTGAAYVFERSGTNWIQQAYLKAGNYQWGALFGGAVSVDGNTTVVGASYEDGGFSLGSDGAAYVFFRNGTNWSQQAYFQDTGYLDYFGRSVSISGDMLAVGADGEDSNTTGANSTPNEGATESGAVYVFVRSGTSWSKRAYLKPSNTGAFDEFGHTVALSGETLVVGAPYEDSLAAGVNPSWNESAADSGAAYIFLFATEIAVEQPAGVGLVDGGSKSFGVLVGATNNLTFRIRNVGDAKLTDLGITIDGANAAAFVVTTNPIAPVSPGYSTTFVVQFAPTNTGIHTATLHIANNDTDENPFDIALTGVGLNPFSLNGVTKVGIGALQFGFTNGSGLPFTVLAATNVTWPISAWSNLGPAIETPASSGQYLFNDAQATNHSMRFYRVQSP